MEEELKMTFDPMTIEHLGVRMYSTLPPVLGELIANSHDADASLVEIELIDAGEKKIIVSDNGTGMSLDDINTKFLRIGRNRRVADGTQTTPGQRKVIGKKGLGKLSFFGIAHIIEVKTVKGGKRNSFILSWDAIKETAVSQNGLSNYQPEIVETNVDCEDSDGTVILLRQIERESDFNPELLANSLARLFICDDSFHIRIIHNGGNSVEVTKEMRYSGLSKQIEWSIPADIEIESEFENKDEIRGLLFSTEKPISPNTKMRGITLFSRRKLVNTPEYFSDSTSSHFFSYLTGWLEVDFIDDLDEDVIGTNRQSLNWTHPEMAKLRTHLQKMIRALEVDWRAKRAQKRKKAVEDSSGINLTDWIKGVPTEIAKDLGEIIDGIVQKSELQEDVAGAAARSLHMLVPENTYYHWKRLHPEIHGIAEDDYIAAKYFDATEKASRLYVQRVKDVGEIDLPSDDNVMDEAFNRGTGKLMVTECSNITEQNIQTGQQLLSKGLVAGCRNPLTHNPEYEKKLLNTRLFDHADCLDMLSLISHLFRRLERSKCRNKK